MAENHAEIPEEIDFNDSDVQNAAKRKTFAPTGKSRRVRFVVTDQKNVVSDKKGTMMISLTCAPLKDPDDANSKGSPTIRHSLIIPKANKAFPGHKAPNTAGLCHGYYRATIPDEIRDYPRFDKEAQTLMFDGEEIERNESEGYRLEVTRDVMNQLTKDWKTPGSRIDDAFFAEVVDNNGYANLRNLTAELPDDCELVPESEWTAEIKSEDDEEEDAVEETEEEEEEEEAPPPPPKKKAAAKAPPAKGKKK